MVLARNLGAGPAADAAVVVLTFPDLVTTILVSGAVSSVLVPEFKRRFMSGDTSRNLLRDLHLAGLAAGLTVAAVITYAAMPLASLLAPGFTDMETNLVASMLGAVSIAIPLTAIAGVCTAYLQAGGRFAVAGLGTFIFNGVLALVILVSLTPDRPGPLAAGIVLAAAIRWIALLADTRRIRSGRATGAEPTRWRELGSRYGHALLATGLILLVPFVGRAVASLGSSGDVALFTYASRIVELPLGTVVTVISIAALPYLTEELAKGERGEFARLMRTLSVLACTVTIPIVIGLGWAARAVADVLYGRGAIRDEQLDIVAALAIVGLASLPAQGVSSLLQAAFIAGGRLRVFVGVNAAALLAYAVVAVPLHVAFGVVGLALAAALVNFAVVVAYTAIMSLSHDHVFVPTVIHDVGIAVAINLVLAGALTLVRVVAQPGNSATIVLAVFSSAAALVVSLNLPHRHLPKREELLALLLRPKDVA